MTPEDARNYLNQQLDLSSGYSRNAIRMLLSEVLRIHGNPAAEQLIQEFDLESRFQISVDSLLRF